MGWLSCCRRMMICQSKSCQILHTGCVCKTLELLVVFREAQLQLCFSDCYHQTLAQTPENSSEVAQYEPCIFGPQTGALTWGTLQRPLVLCTRYCTPRSTGAACTDKEWGERLGRNSHLLHKVTLNYLKKFLQLLFPLQAGPTLIFAALQQFQVIVAPMRCYMPGIISLMEEIESRTRNRWLIMTS